MSAHYFFFELWQLGKLLISSQYGRAISLLTLYLIETLIWFVALRPRQQLWSCGTVSSPNHTFFSSKLEQAVNQYFMHILRLVGWFVGFVALVPGNSYGHVGKVSSPNRTFFLCKLEQAVNQFFVHILSLVTDKNPSWMNQRNGLIETPFFEHFCKQSSPRSGSSYKSCLIWVCSVCLRKYD